MRSKGCDWKIAALLGALLVTGCGGGSGGGGNSSAVRANADTYTVAQGGSLSIPAPGVLANDSGASLSAALVSNVSHGTLTLNSNGSFVYQHNGSGNNDSFVYRASDGSGGSATATVSLLMGNPTAQNSCHSFAANTSYSGRLAANSQSVTFEILSQPVKGSLSADAAGNFTYVPRSGMRGLDQFTFRVRDTSGQLSSAATVSLFIDGVLRVMPLGDSITTGTYTATSPSDDRSIGYRLKLYNDLTATAAGRYTIDFVGNETHGQALLSDPHHEGHGGFIAQEIADGVGQWLNTRPPDIVLLHIGTNDISGNPNASAAPVDTILQNIESWEQTNYRLWVFVARIIRRLDDPNNQSVTAYNNDIAARVAARNNNRFFLVNQETGAGLNYALTANGGDMADNLHPNQSGYDKMADKWRADLIAAGLLPTCP